MNIPRVVGIAVCALLPLCAPSSYAATLALQSFSVGSHSDAVNHTVGWEFEVTQTIAVTALGYYDRDHDGLALGHGVGIFDDAGNLLVSSSVPSGTSAVLDSGFRYVAANETILTPGNTYVIGANNPSDNTDFVAYSTSNLVFDSAIVLHNGRTVFRTLAVNPTFGDQLQFAHLSDPFTATFAFPQLGPNFQFNVVPEPSSLALAAFAVALGACYIVKRTCARSPHTRPALVSSRVRNGDWPAPLRRRSRA